MIKLLKPHVKTLVLVCIAGGAIVYGIAALLVTPLYQSTAVIFPPNTHANMHLVGSGIRFGFDKEIGEQLEILNANEVRDAMIAEFNLYNQYGIDEKENYAYEKMQRAYNKHINLARTINKSIEVSVKAPAPQLAADMANKLIALADAHKSALVKQNISAATDAARIAFEEKELVIKQMTDSLEIMRKAGESVWTYGEERKSSRYQNYELQYRRHLDRYLDLKMRYEELENLRNESVPGSYVVSTAQAAQKPVYPKKGLLAALASVLAGLLFAGFIMYKNT